jgi:hypothetical protein
VERLFGRTRLNLRLCLKAMHDESIYDDIGHCSLGQQGIPQGLKPSVLSQLRDPRLKPWGTQKQNPIRQTLPNPLVVSLLRG